MTSAALYFDTSLGLGVLVTRPSETVRASELEDCRTLLNSAHRVHYTIVTHSRRFIRNISSNIPTLMACLTNPDNYRLPMLSLTTLAA